MHRVQLRINIGFGIFDPVALRLAVQRALAVWAEGIAADWPVAIQNLVPVRTGRLRNSIHSEIVGGQVNVNAVFYFFPLQSLKGADYVTQAWQSLRPQERLNQLVRIAIGGI